MPDPRKGDYYFRRPPLAGLDNYHGQRLTITFQNEFLIARKVEGELLAITPDLITVLDCATCFPLATEVLRYGARVVVTAFPCDPRWRTARGLKTVGPEAFGYDIDYVPIEYLDRNNNRSCCD